MEHDRFLKTMAIMLTVLFLVTVTTVAVSATGTATQSNVVDTNSLSKKCTDFLYIGDRGDDTVKRFDAKSGNFFDTFVSSNSGGLYGPGGILFDKDGYLLVSNQNVNQPISGDILQYNGKTGVFEKELVPSTDKNAPFAPRGIILKDSKLYVANIEPTGAGGPGGVLSYNIKNGKFLGDFDPNVFVDPYSHPRGIVVGPDGKFYVSVFSFDGTGGQVLRFKSNGKFDKVFIADNGGVGQLNRPEGLVFGPDGNLYVTSFRADTTDTDSIRIYSAKGVFLKKIDLDVAESAGGSRAFAQALLFGPNGRLFVPITNTGEVRRYNVVDGSYDIFIKSNANGGELIAPWYLTFGKTDPTTLDYCDYNRC